MYNFVAPIRCLIPPIHTFTSIILFSWIYCIFADFQYRYFQTCTYFFALPWNQRCLSSSEKYNAHSWFLFQPLLSDIVGDTEHLYCESKCLYWSVISTWLFYYVCKCKHVSNIFFSYTVDCFQKTRMIFDPDGIELNIRLQFAPQSHSRIIALCPFTAFCSSLHLFFSLPFWNVSLSVSHTCLLFLYLHTDTSTHTHAHTQI